MKRRDFLAVTASTAATLATRRQTRNVTLVPFHRLFDERYAIYWRISGS